MIPPIRVMHFTKDTAVHHEHRSSQQAEGPLSKSNFRPRGGISPWVSSTCNRSYVVAAVRASAIALVLLALLIVMVLF